MKGKLTELNIHGIQEVDGSIQFSSTSQNSNLQILDSPGLFLLSCSLLSGPLGEGSQVISSMVEVFSAFALNALYVIIVPLKASISSMKKDHSEDPLFFNSSASLLLALFNSSGGIFIFLMAASIRAIAAFSSRFKLSILIV